MQSSIKASFYFLIFAMLACIGVGVSMSGYMGLDQEFTGGRQVIDKILFFKYYIAELLVLYILIVFSFAGNYTAWVCRIVAAPAMFIVWTLQILAFRFSGEFVSLLALENYRAFGTILSWSSAAVALLFFLAAFGAYVAVRQIARMTARRLTVTGVICLAGFLCLGLFVADNNMGGERKSEMRGIARSIVNGRNAPFYSFARLLRDFQSPVEYLEHENYSYSDQLRARKLGLRVRWNSAYPMVHDRYYQEPLPFDRIEPAAKPNVIVFFVESLSARKLEIYGSPIQGVAPALERFAAGSLVVDNYYGHTQSTFRGIRGQLCSMFPFHSSREDQWADENFKFPETTYDCLPHHLDANGYSTVFMGPDHPDHMHFLSQTRSMGFRRNYYREEINEKFLGNIELPYGFLTDAQMADALVGYMDGALDEQPFFLAAYFKSSHLGLNSRFDGKKFGDGSNRVLNTLHTFDIAFGEFWKKFASSKLVDNTIVVVTGDHSHWPEQTWLEIAGEDFNRTPIDRLALMIYSPYHEFPARYDAKNGTSLGFAPMLAQLLGLPHATNSFIGISPFDRNSISPSFTWFNERVYIVNEDDSVDFYNIRREKLPVPASSAYKALKQTHFAEFEDRIVEK